jgi:hypothetical protein
MWATARRLALRPNSSWLPSEDQLTAVANAFQKYDRAEWVKKKGHSGREMTRMIRRPKKVWPYMSTVRTSTV